MTSALNKALEEISNKAANAGKRHALVGLDGFVDKIIRVIDKRTGLGDEFIPIETIDEFGRRVTAAAGNSANFELYQSLEKLGGNGPIMAHALHAQKLQVRYIGALGKPIHPVFEEFAKATNAVSLSEPGITQALEFDDGKLMLGMMEGLDHVTYAAMVSEMGEGALFDVFNRANLIALVNWTMIPRMTELFEDLLNKLLPNLGPNEQGRSFFFDLADPAKRSTSDIKEVLQTMRRFRSHGHVILGLNFAESRQVSEALGLGSPENTEDSLKATANRIRSQLDIGTVVIHPREGAACANRDGSWYVQGPFCKRPKITTGAGDHFNAGFASAMALGMSPVAALVVGVSTSGQYVRTGKSPSLQQTANFIERWQKGQLD
ncbi:MAG: carbohydrate kinase family protein [Opitutales bacterium]|nr:carbohydrate kinase family protein [Opitutales bacterium]